MEGVLQRGGSRDMEHMIMAALFLNLPPVRGYRLKQRCCG